MPAVPATSLAASARAQRQGWSVEIIAIGLITALWTLGVLLPILSLAALSFVKSQGIGFTWVMTLDNYAAVLVDYRLQTILRTLRIVVTVTLIELVLAFPFALWLAKSLRPSWKKSVLLVLLVVPFFLSPAARTIVWRSVLGNNGLINTVLMGLGVIDQPLDWLLFTQFSVHLGLIGPYFPSMVWPLYIAFSLVDDDLITASRDLGAGPSQTLRHVVIPLAMPGIIAGFIFTAVPMLGDNIASALLGGGNVPTLAESFDDLIRAMNYGGAAALAALLVLTFALAFLAFYLAIRGYSARSGASRRAA